MVSIVPMQRRTDQASPAAAAAIFSLERRRREEDEARGGGSMDLSGAQGELPIPMHAPASPYASGGSAGGRVLQQLHRERGNNKGNEESPVRLPPSPPAASEDRGSGKKRAAGGGGSGVKYRECLKNHAAAMGGNATDGCGEFMPSGEEGSLEALKCSACGCHRNFHRKEVDDDDEDLNADVCAGHGHFAGRRLLATAMPPHLKSGGAGGGLLVTADPYGVGAYAAMRAVPPPPPLHHHHHQFVNAMPLRSVHTSEESDGMDGGAGARGSSSSLLSKKRFRTKFTAEQKARMLDFAERVGWRLQKLEDGMVHAFCQEIGVKRRVLKVWMHNNKHSLATKRLEAPPGMASAPAPPPPMPMVPPPPMQMVPPPPPALPSSPQPGPSFHLGGPSSQPPQHMAMPMVPPPPPPPPPFHHRGPGSPAPLKLD